MARQIAQARLLFYPTPPIVTRLIASYFSASQNVIVADPCCGTGEALATFVRDAQIPGETWGVELSYSRAKEAAAILTKVLPASFYSMTPSHWSSASVGLIFNNPPYDFSEILERDLEGTTRRVRHEFLFVENSTRKLVVGGHQVIIIPQSILGDPQITNSQNTDRFARHVLGWYDKVLVYRFPDGEYERFHQVVVLAFGRRKVYEHSTKEQVASITSLSFENDTIPVLPVATERVEIPPSPAAIKFLYTPVEPQFLVRMAHSCSPVHSEEYKRKTHIFEPGSVFHPIMPLTIGHITMLITSMLTGVITIKTPEETMLVKGRSIKVSSHKETERESIDAEGKISRHVNIVERERHEAVITVLHENGDLVVLQKPEEVGAFITKHAGEMADAILEKNQPLYDMKPTAAEWAVTGTAAKGLPPLPGREERGLFDVQRHFAIAANRGMKEKTNVLINAEMGWGKSAGAVTTLMLNNQWPAIVFVPGHMIWKWKREFELSCDPQDKIAARVITRPVSEVDFDERGFLVGGGKYQKAVRAVEANGGIVKGYVRWQENPVAHDDPGGRRRVFVDCAVGLVPKLAGYFPKGKVTLTSTGFIYEYKDSDEYTAFDFKADYEAGRLGKKAIAIIAFDPGKYDAGTLEKPSVFYSTKTVFDEKEKIDIRVEKAPCCPSCGRGFIPGRVPRYCTHRVEDTAMINGVVVSKVRICGTPLFQMSRWRRIGMARLGQKKMRNFFKVYVMDEAHKSKSGRADISVGDQRFLSSTRKSIGLTGTLFGGVASSLFYLLYRRVPEVRALFKFDEVNRWVDTYGLWETEWNEPASGRSTYGKSTNIKRFNVQQPKEIPGIAPGVIRYLLPIVLFGRITDLGYELPSVYEEVITVPMSPKQSSQYEYIEHTVLKMALSEMKKFKEGGAISSWFSACRFRPQSAFRPESIDWDGPKGGSLHVTLPAVTSEEYRWLPKETKLAELIDENMRAGIKTLIFVEQSGTRDIRYRLELALMELCYRKPAVGILSAGDMTPAKREAWIKVEAVGMDVMIVNPKLVETGLDLVMFSSIIFYETTTSLYTLWQALRRVWRLGQTKEVTAYFLAYLNTVEQEILIRMGAKKKAAQLLYGSEASGVLVEQDEDDLQREMLSAAMEGRAFRTAGEMVGNIFTEKTDRKVSVATGPQGSMVAISPDLQILTQAKIFPVGDVIQYGLFGEEVTVKPKKKRA